MTVTSQDTETVRRFYAALAARDLGAAEACFTPDATWHLPGKSPIAGDHHGWPAIRDDFLSKLGPLSGHTFRAEFPSGRPGPASPLARPPSLWLDHPHAQMANPGSGS